MPQRKILILAANPKDTTDLRLDKQVQEIDEGLRRAKNRDHFAVESRLAIRPRDLSRALHDTEPQIVHFGGHGAAEGLILEDDAGLAKLVNKQALSELFSLFSHRIECVVLSACYSVSQAEAISKHIPYVIGMSKEIGVPAALAFSIGFYDALGAGRSYEDAYSFGCNAIHLLSIPEHLIPILHVKPTDSTTNDVTHFKNAEPQIEGQFQHNTKLFYSYSHDDEKLRQQLEQHLSLLKQEGVIRGWHNRDIDADQDWKTEIDSHLNQAQIILLLVSASFLDSDYCHEVELARALERHDKGEANVIPIIMRPCDWGSVPFSKLQALPEGAKPITHWAIRDEAFLSIMKGIRKLAEERYKKENTLTPGRPLASRPAYEDHVDSTSDQISSATLVDALAKVLPAVFEMIIFRLDIPSHVIAPANSAQYLRALDVIRWAEQQDVEIMQLLKEEVKKAAPGLLKRK
jgi:hypothetical protein